MTVSRDNSKAVYQGIRAAGIRFLTALPETWLEPVLRALGLPFEHARDPARVGQQIQDAQALAWSSLGPVALLLMTTIVATVEAVGPDRFHMDLALPENAFRFRRAASAAG